MLLSLGSLSLMVILSKMKVSKLSLPLCTIPKVNALFIAHYELFHDFYLSANNVIF